jgi:tetratricopeptide (TPR) repeat protein
MATERLINIRNPEVPVDVKTALSAARELRKFGQFKLALNLLGVALRTNPSNASLRRSIAITYNKLRDHGEALRLLRIVVTENPQDEIAWRLLGDIFREREQLEEANAAYVRSIHIRPEQPETLHNYALIKLRRGDYGVAQELLLKAFFLAYTESDHSNRAETAVGAPKQSRATLFKIRDKKQQLDYLLANHIINQSFRDLSARLARLELEIGANPPAQAIFDLTSEQRSSLGGYWDTVVNYPSCPRVKREAVNPRPDWKQIEATYQDSEVVAIDRLLTDDAANYLRNFLLEATTFYNVSKAGFVGTYMDTGLCCGLMFQIVEEFRNALPNLLGNCHLSNMWAYRYDAKGVGVRPHTHVGDESVTLNLWLTPDCSNLGDGSSGGMVMYDRKHPPEWDADQYEINARKDDSDIEQRVGAYLAGAKETVIPYRHNRGVLFESTVFHKTDPFEFRDSFVDRRLNITMIFSRRGREAAGYQSLV